jgi:hypothetical protein
MKKAFTILFLSITLVMNAQIIKPNHEKERIPALKNKTIYFVLADTNKAKDFKDVIYKNWTITKFKIITPDQVSKNYSTNNVFFMDAATVSTGIAGAGSTSTSSEYMMWCPREKAIQSGKEIKNLDPQFVEIYFDIKVEGDYWYAGFFKNFLQQIQDYMTAYLAKGKADFVSDADKITELKNATLYVPDYIVSKEKVAELFSKYTNKYMVLPAADINKKISDGENIYYMLTCIYGQNCKIISVINSQTGQIVYNLFDVKPTYPTLRKNDIGDIDKEIGKAKK